MAECEREQFGQVFDTNKCLKIYDILSNEVRNISEIYFSQKQSASLGYI